MPRRFRIPLPIPVVFFLAAGCSPAANPSSPPPLQTESPFPASMPTDTASILTPADTDESAATEDTPTRETELTILPVPLAAGDSHTCTVTGGGAVLCWGSNASGQLGNGTTGRTSLPVEAVGIPQGALAVAAGKNHTCALNAEGSVFCWGANAHGQLGDGTAADRSVPAPVLGLTEKTVRLAAGDSFSCALSASGGVTCWGWNAEGQLGDGSADDRALPAPVIGLNAGVAEIAAGRAHACALKKSGGIVCWGRNYEGQLGNGKREASGTPVEVTDLPDAADSIAAGGTHSCAFLISGKIVCWGYLVYIPEDGKEYTVPRETVMMPERPAAVGMGAYFACFLNDAGGVECWGTNRYGQLGDGFMVDSLKMPMPVKGLSEGVTHLAVGTQHACALLNSGDVRCWGANESWQLGISGDDAAYSPVAVDLSTLHYYYSGIEASAPPEEYPHKYASIWTLTEGFQDLAAPGVNTYAVTVKRESVWAWDFYQCATDTAALEGMLSATKVSFLVDYQPVSEKAIRIFRSNYYSWACQGWTTSLSQWEHDSYELGLLYEYDEPVYDGESGFAAGKYWQILMLKVEE